MGSRLGEVTMSPLKRHNTLENECGRHGVKREDIFPLPSVCRPRTILIEDLISGVDKEALKLTAHTSLYDITDQRGAAWRSAAYN